MSFTRRSALVLGLGATLLSSSMAMAAMNSAFTQASFEAANNAGKRF